MRGTEKRPPRTARNRSGIKSGIGSTAAATPAQSIGAQVVAALAPPALIPTALDCPFCGQRPATGETHGGKRVRVYCRGALCARPTISRISLRGAILAWNDLLAARERERKRNEVAVEVKPRQLPHLRGASLEQVLVLRSIEGEGKPDDPVREVTWVYTPTGKLLAYFDGAVDEGRFRLPSEGRPGWSTVYGRG